MKFAKVIIAYAKLVQCSYDKALHDFYNSKTYEFMRDGISDMHCMSETYLAEEIRDEMETLL